MRVCVYIYIYIYIARPLALSLVLQSPVSVSFEWSQSVQLVMTGFFPLSGIVHYTCCTHVVLSHVVLSFAWYSSL